MAQLLPANTMDDDEVVCSSCGAVFQLIWCKDGVTEVQFCPFCGDDIE